MSGAEELAEAVGRFRQSGAPADLEAAVQALETAPVEAHSEAYESLHQQLRELLDRRPGPTTAEHMAAEPTDNCNVSSADDSPVADSSSPPAHEARDGQEAEPGGAEH